MEGERGIQATGRGLSHRGRTAPGAAGAGGPVWGWAGAWDLVHVRLKVGGFQGFTSGDFSSRNKG